MEALPVVDLLDEPADGPWRLGGAAVGAPVGRPPRAPTAPLPFARAASTPSLVSADVRGAGPQCPELHAVALRRPPGRRKLPDFVVDRLKRDSQSTGYLLNRERDLG